MNEKLQKEVTMDEIEVAIKRVAPFKSPGPNCFGAGFYQTYWALWRMRYVMKY